MIINEKVLDYGFVELVDMMGDDYRILQSARVSTGGSESKGDSKDKGLIRYLYKNEHLTPFEQVTLTWHVKAPIFVFRQWHRHRTWSYNEYSGRYSSMIENVYKPEQFYKQSDSSHQGSGLPIEEDTQNQLDYKYNEVMKESWSNYQEISFSGVAKEQARMVLPVAQYSEMYATVNLRNLFHFLELRMDSHAQFEIREYANSIFKILMSLDSIKWSMSAFNEFRELRSLFRECINAAKKKTFMVKDTLENLLEEFRNS